jgi:hypothetical protein
MSDGIRIALPTRKLDPKQVELLQQLNVGDRIQLTQTVRVGSRTWDTTVIGAFRSINYLATGVTTDRIPEDDIVMPMVHFTKDNGEHSSVALDEHSVITRV